MSAKETKDRTGCSDVNCGPENFQAIREILMKCGTDKEGHFDCSAMMEAMKDQCCCGTQTKDTKC